MKATLNAPCWAVSAARQITKSPGHKARVEATYQASLASIPEVWSRWRLYIAALRLAADIVGIGGPEGLGSLLKAEAPDPQRHPAFQGLGSGRRYARDGWAWAFAAHDAAERLPRLIGIKWGGDGVPIFRFRFSPPLEPESEADSKREFGILFPPRILGGEEWFRAAVYAALRAAYDNLPE